MLLGSHSILNLSESIEGRSLNSLNLAHNLINDFCLQPVKHILKFTNLKSLNLASNKISGVGFEQIADSFINNKNLVHLDLGLVTGC